MPKKRTIPIKGLSMKNKPGRPTKGVKVKKNPLKGAAGKSLKRITSRYGGGGGGYGAGLQFDKASGRFKRVKLLK